MVGAHLPERVVTLHAFVANQGVDQTVLERVPHV